MRTSSLLVIVMMTTLMCATGASGPIGEYRGPNCEGRGDVEFLRLIDESFAFFHPNAEVPNVAMLYQRDRDTFTEGAGWGAWWIQNSYGAVYASLPYVQEPWRTLTQKSLDLFWDNQGDGKRMGLWGGKPTGNLLAPLVAPDGCLGDAAVPGQIAYKQGDGNVNIHDWFYEATAAGVVMQTELLLVGRDLAAVNKYLPNLERACNFIESARDPKNNLFLVGPACNLLAPSYGGIKQPDGKFGKGYLAGLSITYLAALDRMVELFKLLGDKDKLAVYEHRRRITFESLPLLLTDKGYFVKSIEPNGTKHGVVGQGQYGYFEGVANVDAVALRAADDTVAKKIYEQMAALPGLRPFDWVLTNYPGLDDTYVKWGSRELPSIWAFGVWVNGGVWGTVEGRAILAYYRLGKFEDIRRSAVRAMKWAKDFRMDAPWTQCGENTDNLWYERKPTAIMVDNFAIPAATVRGLFEYLYKADRLILHPHVPATIAEYRQKEPIWFGEKRILLSCINGGMKVKSVKVNGRDAEADSPDQISLLYETLPSEARVEIVTEGGWPEQPLTKPLASAEEPPAPVSPAAELPEILKEPAAVLSAMSRALEKEPDANYELAFVSAALQALEARRIRSGMNPKGYFRPITPERKAAILKAYEDAALNMYKGLGMQMSKYDQSPDPRRKHIARLFQDVKAANGARP